MTTKPSEVLRKAKENFHANQRFNQWQHIFFVSDIIPGTPEDFYHRAKADIDLAIALAEAEEILCNCPDTIAMPFIHLPKCPSWRWWND